MSHLSKLFSITALSVISGCASLPTGPNVMVLPATGVAFDHFRNDDTLCEQYALTQVSNGTNQPSGSTMEMQERYDVAYVQCMYAKGHRVPVSGPFSDVTHSSKPIPPPPPGTPPAPPSVSSSPK